MLYYILLLLNSFFFFTYLTYILHYLSKLFLFLKHLNYLDAMCILTAKTISKDWRTKRVLSSEKRKYILAFVWCLCVTEAVVF